LTHGEQVVSKVTNTSILIKLPYYVIKGGAHHLDLRLPTDADVGTDVEWVREAEANDLEGYILAYQALTEAVPIVITA